MRGINTNKLLILAILGFCAVIIGSAVLTLQLYVTHEKKRLGLLGRTMKREKITELSLTKETVTTIKPSTPISSKDIFRNSNAPPNSRSYQTIQQAYWRQAAVVLQRWDALLQPSLSDEDDGRHDDEPPLLIPQVGATATAKANAAWALEQAVDAGYPMAQHYWANAHASGIWPISDMNHSSPLQVFDEWSPAAQGAHPQLSKAFLLWHMAAIGGNTESALALAYRISELNNHNNKNVNDEETTCQDVLPYFEAAAHGIMDQLEASPHSRAKILPPMDRHVLARVHMHGGTSSQLDWNNKPDESKEAIQFYHLKATTTRWTSRITQTSSNDPAVDIQAAYTLAHLYHHGYRGVPQNLTKSLMYYEIAATHGHWDSAGEAGNFYLWGIGTQQNIIKAWQMFQIGAPFGLEGCQRTQEQAFAAKLASKSTTPREDVLQCDPMSVNGLGLLHLLGIPNKIPVDMAKAEKFFTLAKEMGSADAMYHLSMMWLGWKTHFKHVEDLVSDGMSSLDPMQAFPQSEQKHFSYALHYSERTNSYHKGPVGSEVQDAVTLLNTAASKGHLQAKHRLAMIYSEGVSIQTNTIKYESVKPSCQKARALYQWIADNASLQLSKRLRKAYKAYTDGDLEVSLRNYLAAAETGSGVGQVNAAFLLERGTCLDLSPADCAKASVRLWKAAAARGNAEACLRVGDFYYYGRLRASSNYVGPFGWVQYILYPEDYLPNLLSRWRRRVWNKIQSYYPVLSDEPTQAKGTTESQSTTENLQHDKELLEGDLSTAAHYYTEASEKYLSPRANFNLGFMYEWGLGVKQDFPLAKRHYDLSGTAYNGKIEAEVAVQIALWALSAHEYVVKLRHLWDDRHRKKQGKESKINDTVKPPKASESSNSGQPVPGMANAFMHKSSQDVILSHIFNWSSLMVVVLLFIVARLRKIREERRRR